MATNINDLIIKTILEYPFYALVASGLQRVESKDVARIGVSLSSVPKLYYNSDFLSEVTMKEAQGVLIHELLHVLFFHTVRARNKHIGVWNIACDIVVNSKIDNSLLLCDAVTLYKANALFGLRMKPDLSAEEYYDQLMQNESFKERAREKGDKVVIVSENESEEEKELSINKMETFDSEMGSYSMDTESMIKGSLKKLIDDTTKAAGVVPANIARNLEAIYAPPKVKWQIMLRKFLDGRGRVKYSKTHLRESRRFEDFMGKRKQVGLNVLVALDTSGSIKEDEFTEFMAELRAIQKITGANIQVVECDTEVRKSMPLIRYVKKGERTGYEGTAFDPVFRYADRHRYQFVVYFTDGYGELREPVKQKVLWVISRGGRRPSEIGTCVYL